MNMNRVQKEMHGHVNSYIQNNRDKVPATVTFTDDQPTTEVTAIINKNQELLGIEIDENLQYLGVLWFKEYNVETLTRLDNKEVIYDHTTYWEDSTDPQSLHLASHALQEQARDKRLKNESLTPEEVRALVLYDNDIQEVDELPTLRQLVDGDIKLNDIPERSYRDWWKELLENLTEQDLNILLNR